MQDKFIVCGSPGSVTVTGTLALCSKCGADILPTAGTLVRALVEDIPLICMDCFAKLEKYEFGGVMHHGDYLALSVAGEFYRFIEEWKKSRR